jgi:5'-3' exonuclease
MKTWLVLDVHYLCHRAFHTAKGLSWKGRPTGVIFQFLKSIAFLKDELQSDRVAFCFEHPHLFRRDIYPTYKLRRRLEKSPEETRSYNELSIQISELRQRYLPKIGFKNIFCFRGMEADDIMATIADNCLDQMNEQVILVTGDLDLLQCLRPNVMIYSPQKQRMITEEWFVSQYGFPPRKWAVVKAIAGCHGDEVKGVGGVGELTAVKYVKGELAVAERRYQAISCAEGGKIVRRNRRLVQLPFEGCPVPSLQEDDVDLAGWKEVCGLLGMRSIAAHPPIATRKRGMVK